MLNFCLKYTITKNKSILSRIKKQTENLMEEDRRLYGRLLEQLS